MGGERDMERVGTGSLERRLGSWDGAAVIVSNVVGVGIFTTPGLIAAMVPGPGAFLGVWVCGGVLALIGALVYAELGGAYPEAGGEYVYLREAFGPLVAFLSGWTSLVAGFTGAIAAGAVGVVLYLDRLVPGLAGAPAGKVIALTMIGGLALVHARGTGPGRRVQNALAALSVASVAALVLAGLALPGGVPSAGAPAAAGGQPGGAGWPEAGGAAGGPLLALVLVMFTYSGWNAATYLAGEMRAPGRTLHRAVISGTLLVTGLYLGLNLLYLRAVPALPGSLAVADLAGEAVLGRAGGLATAVVVILALASGVSAMLLAGPRVYFAMARDGALPARFGRVDPATRAPAFAVAAQAVWAGVLVLTGTFEALLTYTAFAVVLFSAAAVAALFVLRRRPDYDRRSRVRAPGYPWAPALFLLASGAMLVQALRYAPGPSLAGAGLIAAGVPVYLWTRRRPAQTTGAAAPAHTLKGEAQ